MARIFANVLIWLALTAEVEGFVFHGLWSTPLTALDTFIFRGQFGVIPWDLFVVVTILTTMASAKKNRIRVVDKAIVMTLGGLTLTWLWGAARGGDIHQSIWQIHNFIVGALFTAWLVMNTCRTKAHVKALTTLVLSAAVYRCFVLLAFYYIVARGHPDRLPYLTEHTDSVLFVTGAYVAISIMLERMTVKNVVIALAVVGLAVIAIVLNNRRIAWLAVGIGAVVTYVSMPPGKMKRRMTRLGIAMMPVLAAYIAVGWGRPTGIFKPVGSISSMFGAHQDMSSIMRDVENYNLVRTLRTNIVLGTGWGHGYIEEIVAIDISAIFGQYRFLPHNSLLGLVAFTGFLGFGLIWQVVVTSVFFHSRVLHGCKDPTLRASGLWCIVATSAVVVQYWGDLGFNHLGCNVLLGTTIGIAGRTAALAGLWPGTATADGAAARAPASAIAVAPPAQSETSDRAARVGA